MSEPHLPTFSFGAVYFRKSNPPKQDWERDYATAAADDESTTTPWNKCGGGSFFTGSGWSCGENRVDVGHQLRVPPLLDQAENCTVVDTDTVYEKTCCFNPSDQTTIHDGCDRTTYGTCSFYYRKDKTVEFGGIEVEQVTG